MHLGLDLGTSGLKAVLIDEDETLLGEATEEMSVSRPHDGWSEQDPAEWLAAAERVFDALAGIYDLSGLRSIGLSGQMHGATLLDAGDDVLRPCILWNDVRAAREAGEMDAEAVWRDVTGNIVFPGFTAPKVEWVRRHEPELFDRTARVLLPKDYLRLWLTGEHVSEMSDAAGTAWLDTGGRDWSDDLLSRSGLSREAMPRLVEGSEVSGTVREALCRRWGIPEGTPVAGGGGDNAASAVGAGCLAEGAAFVSLGSSGVLFAANEGYRPSPETAVHTFCHALPGRWHQMGVILAATDVLNWLSRLLGRSPEEITRNLGPLQAPGPLFLPYLGGERTPHNDAEARGALVGLTHGTDTAAMTRAALEGVAFAFRDCADALAETGTRIERALAIGGGSRSDYWLRSLATALGLPLDVPEAGEFGGAFGAARLGRMALTGEIRAERPPIARTIEPDADLADAYAEAHDRWQRTYRALKEAR